MNGMTVPEALAAIAQEVGAQRPHERPEGVLRAVQSQIDKVKRLQVHIKGLNGTERKLRDDFACFALQIVDDGTPHEMAKEAYAIADAMMEVRRARGEEPAP